MNVAQAVGRCLVRHGIDHVFGVVGSGNFHVTNAMIEAGARFVPAAHEGGAASMADGYARVAGRAVALSVHQGPGFTNALTGIAEAAKSRTPLVVLAPEATNPRSNFHIDLPGVVVGVGARFLRVSAERVAADVADACALATSDAGCTIVLGLPLDVQDAPAPGFDEPLASPPQAAPARPDPGQTAILVNALAVAARPVFIAGRGAARRPDAARAALGALADRCGALLAVSAAAKGLFAGDPWYVDISGGFATPLAAELISQADLVVGWGSTLNMWTTRHGRLIPPAAVVAQVDLDPGVLGANRPVAVGVVGDVVAVAEACAEQLDQRAAAGVDDAAAGPAYTGGAPPTTGRRPAWSRPGWRTPEVRARIAVEGSWRSVSYVDESDGERIDPRTLSIALDDMLPAQRTVVVDSGNFMGYPSMFLSVPDVAGFCFTQAYQSIGLGLPSALGAAIARPDRLTVAAVGDGGFLMSVAELATAARLGEPLLVVVYNDAAYGAEVHHFGPDGHPVDTVTFPDTDLADVARGFGCAGLTVHGVHDLAGVASWLDGPRERPLVVDAKVVSSGGSWWLEEAFRGH